MVQQVGSMSGKAGFDNTQYLQWEREALSRLYYGFWIVFLAGFMYSLGVRNPVPRGISNAPVIVPYIVLLPPSVVWCTLLVFRLLAVLGTGVNFWMQYQAVAGLGHMSIYSMRKGNDPDEAARRLGEAKKADRHAVASELPLQRATEHSAARPLEIPPAESTGRIWHLGW